MSNIQTLSAKQKADQFLAESHQFMLGRLPTEQAHPMTKDLSLWAKNDIPLALEVLKKIDLKALQVFSPVKLQEIQEMADQIQLTLSQGGRIFFCGCGATGRLSLTLEALWRETYEGQPETQNKVFSFMAGGDYALVRSIENFEDHPEFGARQLHDLKFGPKDLLISTTEGGETPFVIGATEEAAKISQRAPYFLYCNPDDILCEVAERSAKVLRNPQIKKINLSVGPMALSGSTRMQATTVLMLGAGAALFTTQEKSAEYWIENFVAAVQSFDFKKVQDFVVKESEIYQSKNYCLHSSKNYAITVLTDTTERSPTFSLLPFENDIEKEVLPSWTYLNVPGTTNSRQSWTSTLHRHPRGLEWSELGGKYDNRILEGFDFSDSILNKRKSRAPTAKHFVYKIDRTQNTYVFELDDLHLELEAPAELLHQHLLLKLILNSSSCLVMGRLGRFENNLMLWVKSSNKKLIDRSIRYVSLLVEHATGSPVDYKVVAYALFEEIEKIKMNESVVMKTADRLILKNN
jgi:N-acetylmuramic acid 6-phosphate etherase